MIYQSATAFKNALGDRLRTQAAQEGVSVERLQRRLAFERFLARLFYTGAEPWVLKGGYALELRFHTSRSTRDLDLNVPLLGEAVLLEQLQAASEQDLGDYFQFIVSRSKDLAGPPQGGIRFHVEVRLDGKIFTRFPLDVGQGDQTIQAPEWIEGRVDLSFAGLAKAKFLVYPLVDHFAEKLHAYTTPRENPSRVKDLVDMLLMIEAGLEGSEGLKKSIEATFNRYDRHPLHATLPRPPENWDVSFMALADEAGLRTQKLDDGYQALEEFLIMAGVFQKR